MADRQTVFLLPGLLCDAWVWEHQVASLGGEHDVHVADFFGHDSIEGMARSVLDAAGHTGGGRFAVAGHSMGGRVALDILRLAPERVTRLALLDTGVHPARDSEAESRGALVALAREQGMAALAARWMPPMMGPAHQGDTPVTAGMTAMICRATPDIFAGQQNALLHRRDAAPQLPGIAVPTLVACGRDDKWSTLAQHEAFAAHIPNATVAVVEDSGHMVSVEQPEAVTALLRAWLA